jgi:transposase-like protein
MLVIRTWWTRLQPIRTVSEIELEFMVFTQEQFEFQRIGGEARAMRQLGMSLRAIGAELGVDEKTVRKALKAG